MIRAGSAHRAIPGTACHRPLDLRSENCEADKSKTQPAFPALSLLAPLTANRMAADKRLWQSVADANSPSLCTGAGGECVETCGPLSARLPV